MCGRYTLTKPVKTIQKQFDPIIIKCEHSERYNIAPSQNAPVVILQEGQRELISSRWGLVPPWVKDIKTAKALINARSETVHQKPSFRDSFRTHRCLIPTDGFIEWKVERKEKVPHFISLKSRKLFAFAGIWAEWGKGPASAHTYSILTTQANSALTPVHERMPVIIEPSSYKIWLAPETATKTLHEMLTSYNSIEMNAHQISKDINSYKNDRDDLLNPIPSS